MIDGVSGPETDNFQDSTHDKFLETKSGTDFSNLLLRISTDVSSIYPYEIAQFTSPEQQESIIKALISVERWRLVSEILQMPGWERVDRNPVIAAVLEQGLISQAVRLLTVNDGQAFDEQRVISLVTERVHGNTEILPGAIRLTRALRESQQVKHEASWEERIKINSEARQAVTDYIGLFGLSAQRVQKTWLACGTLPDDYSSQAGLEYSQFVQNIETMTSLELRSPGGVKALSDEYGIEMFGRYGDTALSRQLEQSDDATSPYGVMIFPKFDDNGAFYEYKRDILGLQD